MIKQNKSFCGMIHMIFLGLKIDRLTLEVLHWILRSLRNDEMLPSERAILSRVKEAFDIKPSEEEWESLL